MSYPVPMYKENSLQNYFISQWNHYTVNKMKVEQVAISRHTVMCGVAKFGVAKFGCARHCVLSMNQLLVVYSIKTTGMILIKIMSLMPYSSLAYVSNLKGIGPVIPKIHGSKSCLNFSSSQHSLIHFKTTFPYFEFRQICTVNYAI